VKLRGEIPDLGPRRILLIQLRRIGDVLLCTPAIRALHEMYPHAQIDFAAETPCEEVLRGHPLIRKLCVAPKRGLLDTLSFIRQIRVERYDWVVDFLANPRSAQMTFLTRARVRAGLAKRGRGWAYNYLVEEEKADADAYAADLRLSMLRELGIASRSRRLEIYCDLEDPAAQEKAHAALRAMSGVVVAIAAGNANNAKRYPADLTASVIDLLRAQGMQVVLTSGPGEGEFGEAILKYLKTPVGHMKDARVADLAALYRKCALYVGPDSGPKHIAVACGISTVTIFGPGRPSNWNDAENPNNVVLVAPCDRRPNCVEAECAKLGHIRLVTPREVLAASLRALLK
jgi:ADP-heptose:LPS heptosyltransferase